MPLVLSNLSDINHQRKVQSQTYNNKIARFQDFQHFQCDNPNHFSVQCLLWRPYPNLKWWTSPNKLSFGPNEILWQRIRVHGLSNYITRFKMQNIFIWLWNLCPEEIWSILCLNMMSTVSPNASWPPWLVHIPDYPDWSIYLWWFVVQISGRCFTLPKWS